MVGSKKLTQIIHCIIIGGLLLPTLPLKAQQLKKVAVLELVNLDKDPQLEYLKSSLTDAIDSKLQEKFAYARSNPQDIAEVAKANYFYGEDFSTKSVAINLGLVAQQDVIISGGFIRVAGITAKGGKKNEGVIAIVRIYDIPQKNIVAEVQETSPIDDSIFDMTERVSNRIAEAAKAVLPSKEEFKRSGGKLTSGPWFDNFSFSLGIGGGMYSLAYANRIAAQLPAARAALNMHLPIIAKNFTFHLGALYFNEKPIEGKNPAIEGLNITSTNLMPGGYFGWRFHFSNLGLTPRLGGGYVLQQITVTGLRNENLNNSMPFVGGGMDLAYAINRNLELQFTLESFAQLQGGKTTLGNFALLGLGVRF